MTDAYVWESADTVDEGEYLFVYVHDGVAKYGVGTKAWASADDPTEYVVANFPWAGRPTHAMQLPKPPFGKTFDDYLEPSRAQAHAAIWKRMVDDLNAANAAIDDLQKKTKS